MKKSFLFIIGIALAGMVYSCGESKPMNLEEAEVQSVLLKKVDPSALSNEKDSLSYYLGFNEGMAVATNMGSLPEDIRSNFHLNDYLTGVTAVMKSDTAKLGYTDGINEGLRLLDIILNYEDAGININREMLVQAMSARMLSPVSDDSVLTADGEVFTALVSRASEIITKATAEQNDSK
ncbi:MAG: hypothetical protein K2M94_08355 [Paramuribaculum sp.]|nr:hypothetical protein [Paramuribaculum sp.]